VKNNNNILDNYLQQKVEEANFEFEEAHWQHALSKLQQEDDKKPIFWWRTIMFGIAFIAMSIGAFIWVNKKATPAVTQLPPATLKASDTPAVAAPTITENSTTLENSNAPIQLNTDINNDLNKTSEPISNIKNENNNIIKVEPEQKNTIAKNKNNFIAKIKNTLSKDVNTDSTSNERTDAIAKIEKINPETITPAAKVLSAKAIVSNVKNKIANLVLGIKNKTKTAIKVNSEPKANELLTANTITKIKKSKAVERKNIIKDNSKGNEQNKALENITTVNDNTTANVKPAMTPEQQQQLNTRYVKGLNNYKQKEKPLLKYDTIMITPSSEKTKSFVPTLAAVLNTKNNTTVTGGNTQIGKPSLMLNASVSIAKAPLNIYNNASNYTVNPWLSLGYYWPINNKLSIQTMLGFTYLSGLSFEYSAYKTRYNFGVDSSTYKLINKTMYQLYTPITIGYQLASKQQVFVGGGISYGFNMLNAEKDFGTSIYKKTWGSTEAYRQLDAFATLGYQYQILKNMYAQFSYIQGFTDITKNSIQANTITDRNSRFQIGIQIKLK
jgi:hypothetical protein